MAAGVRTQATLILAGPAYQEQLRHALDPTFASRLSLHVTLIYDDEAPDIDLLIQRLRLAGACVPPIALRLGTMARFKPPADGLSSRMADLG